MVRMYVSYLAFFLVTASTLTMPEARLARESCPEVAGMRRGSRADNVAPKSAVVCEMSYLL